jgi:3-oxo-5-alpha-steroid 4-dehydrogenase 1
MEREAYSWLLVAWVGVAACVFIALQFLTAPYGRHARPGWGPTIHRTAGWVIMESPAVVVFVGCFLLSGRRDPASLVFLGLWLLHYAYRAFIYPFRLRGGQLRMPLSVVAMAFGFNVMNGYLQGRGIFTLGPERGAEWLSDPRFIGGVLLFLGGYALNQQSDLILRRLRAPGESGYKVPFGGAFALVSCPNYFAELVEWLGWAMLTWSPAGLVFFLWTATR